MSEETTEETGWTDQTEYLARREREKARLHVKFVHLVGLFDRLAHDKDQLVRRRTQDDLVAAFEDLVYEGPGPDPEDEARRKKEWEGRLPTDFYGDPAK